MTVLGALSVGVLGLIVGSFLNVVVHRVPSRASIIRPASHCPRCDRRLTPSELVPVLSWVVQRGRCRGCGDRISMRYPLIEATCAALFVAALARFGLDWDLPAFLAFFAVLLAVTAIDLEHYIVPNRIVAWSMAVGVPLLGAAALLGDDLDAFVGAAIGSAAAGGFLLVVHLVQPRGMGMGDVKLALVLGLHLGWLGPWHVALGLFSGFALGAAIGLLLIVAGRRGRKDHVPFAPFLAGGALLAVLAGDPIIDWYRDT